ncbi:MAG: ATP-binding protein, partial [Bacteroidaceae bacterium]|nr:ATP-binding protein [Bacteroidaceae bacterium]
MIIGRKQEQEMLNNAYNSDKGEFVIVYGRRRVGKTFLVRKVFAGQFDFHVTGLFRKNKKRQLENFANALSEYSGKDVVIPRDWYEAFRMLRQYLQTLGDKRKVVFIDEMPWMATAKSDFVGALETFWNGWGAGDDTLKLIVCGSASSWFTDNVFSNKGGLFNRDTMRIYLRPFTLHETEEYMQAQGIVMNRYEIIECYMIMGGIPYYLSKLNKGYSLAQNIDMMFFRPKALLFDEFEHLYDAL